MLAWLVLVLLGNDFPTGKEISAGVWVLWLGAMRWAGETRL